MTSRLALKGGTVYARPGEPPLRDVCVFIEDGTIVAIDRSATPGALDCRGCSIFAGFWNCHVHFFERKWSDAADIPAGELTEQLQELTRYGFTSVFDLSSDLRNTKALRERISSGEVEGPFILTTGEGLVPPAALPSDEALRVLGTVPAAMPVVETPETARIACENLLREGADAIKLFASSNSGASLLSEASMRAACDAAHAAGKTVFVHPNTAADVVRSLNAGVGVIAHTTPRSPVWNEELLALAREKDAALIPTLRIWHELLRHDRRSLQQTMLATAIAQLRAWHESGGPVVFGTDVGAVDADPADEYRFMARAGLTFDDILASLTTEPAKRFGRGERIGEIAPGFRADIAVVNGDARENPAKLSDVRYTIRGGAPLMARRNTSP